MHVHAVKHYLEIQIKLIAFAFAVYYRVFHLLTKFN